MGLQVSRFIAIVPHGNREFTSLVEVTGELDGFESVNYGDLATSSLSEEDQQAYLTAMKFATVVSDIPDHYANNWQLAMILWKELADGHMTSHIFDEWLEKWLETELVSSADPIRCRYSHMLTGSR